MAWPHLLEYEAICGWVPVVLIPGRWNHTSGGDGPRLAAIATQQTVRCPVQLTYPGVANRSALEAITRTLWTGRTTRTRRDDKNQVIKGTGAASSTRACACHDWHNASIYRGKWQHVWLQLSGLVWTR